MTEFQVMSQNLTEDAVSVEHDERAKELYVFADVSTSFIILVGVFFPSVTGLVYCKKIYCTCVDNICKLLQALWLVRIDLET